MTLSDGGALAIPHLAEIEPIGRMGRGTVFAATDRKLDRRVAVVVSSAPADDAERTRFERESKVLGHVSAHPNVVTVYDAGVTAAGEPYLIMELVGGPSLAELLDVNGPLAWQEAAGIVVNACDGLQQAHEAGLLHRDVRPAHVIMVGMAPRLTGFGVTALTDGPLTGAPTASPAAVLHTAPECFEGRGDERSDLYSLASTLFTLIDGRPPYWRPGADSIDALRLRLAHEPPPNLDPERGPPELNRFLTAALSRDPLDRPQSAHEFADELRIVLRHHRADGEPSLLHDTTASLPAVAVAGAATIAGPGALRPGPYGPPDADRERSAPDTVTTSGPPLATLLSTPVVTALRPDRDDPTGPAAFVAPFSDLSPPAGTGPGSTGPGGGTASGPGSTGPGSTGPGSEAGATERPPRGDEPPTSVSGLFGSGGSDGADPSGSTPLRPPLVQDDHRWSPAFLGALAMIVVGVLGLVSVFAISRFRTDDDPVEDAVALPAVTDPSLLTTVEEVEVGEPAPTTTGSPVPTTSTTEAEEVASTTTTTAATVSVPNVVGLDVDGATRALTDAGFGVNVIGQVLPAAPAGVIAQQVPAGGGAFELPLSVTLIVPRTATLPPMVGKTGAAACLELEALQVECVEALRHDATVAPGLVISTDPAEGTTVGEGSTVQVVVSKGPVVNVAVPDLVNRTRAEAEQALAVVGLTTVSFEMESSAAVESGRVVRSEPTAGTSLASDQPVVVYVSSGPPERVTVPEVLGRTEAEASTTLAQAGLAVAVVTQDLPAGDPGIGTVVAVDPVVGTEVDTGSTVTITVGRDGSANSEASTTTAPAPSQP